jgi:hypothetical protein
LTIRGDDDLWAQRLEEIRAIPSARSTEIAQAERDLLGSRTNTALLQASLAAYQRESAELRAFATASPSERAAWPITRENLGVFLSSWRRPVPCSAPFLSISLPILRAAASAHGTLDARLADASALEERLAALRQSATKGVVNEVAVRGAEAALAAGQAKVASERERKRVAQLELDLFQNLARQAGAEPLSSKSSGPRELADALLQAASPETSWIYGLFQLWEERAVAGLEARDRTRLEERANDYLSGVKKLASPMASELSRASNQSRLATAQRLAAEEALQLVELEWDQWLAIANLGREAADPVGIPAPVLPQTQIIAEAEAEVARQWAASFAPEKAQREEAAKQLAELNRCGASTNFEVQQAEQRSVLAQAKWSAAQQDLRVTSAQRQLASDLAAQGANLLSPADLSESARRSLTTVNQLRLEPRAAEIAGLQAAAAMASSREGALSRLVRNGFAGALRAPVSKPQEFQLPPLE